jgi:hypothetical protein
MALFPIVVTLPNGVSGNRVCGVPAAVEIHVFEIDGLLRALTTGPHVVNVRDPRAGTILGTLTWNAAGLLENKSLDLLVPPDSGLVFDVPTLGTGALDCTITVWCQVL